MATGVERQFNNILLGGRSGTSPGHLNITASGVFWKKSGGGKTIEILSKDIVGFIWSLTAKGGQLAVKRVAAPMTLFHNFRDADSEIVKECLATLDKPLEAQEMACSGRNWGSADIDAATLVFRIGGKPAFRVPLRDVGQVQQGRDEISMDFSIDDTTGGEREDALVGMSFHVPKDAEGYPPADEDTPSTTIFYSEVVQHTDTGAAVGDPVATFDGAAVLAPRGRFSIELYLSFLKLTGQAQDYRIQYDSIVRVFVLPKSHTPHTLVVVSLDPPIRKGQTFYPHILVQLPTEEDATFELELTDDQLAAKNEKCGNKLQRSMDGPQPEVFARLVRGLAATKLTKPGNFRTSDGSFALRCSFKADDGYLYPLERAFFYIHKPPTLIIFDEIDSVEFLRQGGGLVAASVKTFDLNVRQRTDQEFLFRGIQKQEWNNLFSFLQAKRIRIENLEEAQQGPGGNAPLDFTGLDLGEDIDTGLAQQRAKGEVDDEEEEDEDFAGEDVEDDAEDAGDDGEEEEEDDEEEKPKKKRAAKPKADKPAKKAKAEKPTKAKAEKPAKKEKKKKDPNAPKRGMSAFMFFSNENRAKAKQQNPEASFGDLGKKLGEMWKTVDAKEKSKYEDMAKKDKERYEKAKKEYEAKNDDSE